jgi:hypothetical protein
MCVGEWSAVPHSDKGEKLVEHVVCIDSEASTFQFSEGDPLSNKQRGEIKAQASSPME